MKTAETIEAEEERKKAQKSTVRVAHNSKPVSKREADRRERCVERLKPLRFVPGVSGNPGGRPARDIASEIAQALFTNHPELIYEAFLKVLRKGSPYGFAVLADRAFGRLKETHMIEHNTYSAATDEDIEKRIAELKAQLGVEHIPKVPASEPQLLPPADDSKVQ